MTALLFDAAPQTGQPVALVFGADVVGIPPVSASLTGTFPLSFTAVVNTREKAVLAGAFPPLIFTGQISAREIARLDGTFPPLVFTAQAVARDVARLAGVFAPLSFTCTANYSSNTARPTVGQVASNWQTANPGVQGAQALMQRAQPASTSRQTHWQVAAALVASTSANHRASLRSASSQSVRFEQAIAVASPRIQALFADATRAYRPALCTLFQSGVPAHTSPLAIQLQDGQRDRRISAASAWQNGIGTGTLTDALASVALRFNAAWRTWYEQAMRPRPGQYQSPIQPPEPEPCYLPNTDLLFSQLWADDTSLVFVCERHVGGVLPDTVFYILPSRVYMTTHNLTALRLPDLAPVPLYSATLSADVGSFAWQFSATGPANLMEQLAPTASNNTAIPQQLQITLDGMTWVFVVESLKQTHAFGKRAVSISGRSATALVGAPFRRELAYSRATPANAQQLAELALDLSGVALDWGITDWLVPANAWSTTGTPLSAVQAIAEAAGGYLQSHRSAPTLQVRHPYPPRPDGSSGGPWNWGTGSADIALALDAVITSGIERRDGPDINAVYVSGTAQGVLAWVKRTGTAGEKLAAMQTDALITASEAAQQRGLAVLGKAGPQYAISLELPILTGTGQPGVIDVGRLVQINDSTPWRGRVRSVSVNAAMPVARQTLTLERHL